MQILATLLVLLLVLPLAVRTGRAKAERLRGLRDDLINGRARGYWIVAAVILLVVIAKIDFAMRN